jgi:hypothetical protein
MNPITKSLHYAWSTDEPLLSPRGNVYYGNGTITTRVNGSVESRVGSQSKPVAVDGSGTIHIVFVGPYFQLYYTSSSDSGLTFTEPSAIPGAVGDWFAFTADSSGNLYLAYDIAHYFMKKPAGGSWSSPYLVNSGPWGADPSMAVYDSNRIYIAVGGMIAATSDGGQTWTIYTTPGSGSYESSIAVDSNGILNFAWQGVSPDNNVYFSRTDRSHDPSRWGQAVIALPGAALPNIAVNSAGKAYIMARIAYVEDSIYRDIAVFTKEK